MAKNPMNPKAALASERVEIRRNARGKSFVGDDTGAAAGRAAELAKVRHLQQVHRERQIHESSIPALLGKLVSNTGDLAKTVLGAPLRLATALRGRRASA